MTDVERGIVYRYLGDFNAAEPWAAVALWCDKCEVRWTGCWDNFQCPDCEDATAWVEEMEWRREQRQAARQIEALGNRD